MQLLFRLPFLLLETFVRQGLTGLAALARIFVRGNGEEDLVMPVAPPPAEPRAPRSYTGPQAPAPAPPAPAPPSPSPAPSSPAPSQPTAEEAIERRFEREAAAGRAEPSIPEPAVPAPPPAPTPVRPELGPDAHVDREATVVESFGPPSDVGGILIVEAPWEGYDAMPAAAVIARLRGSDDATKGVARLYEQNNKNRATVLRATG